MSDAYRQQRRTGALLIGPALILIIAVNVLPAIYGFYSSLRRVFFFADEGFVGLDNYIELFRNPLTWRAIGASLAMTFGSLAIAVPLAMLAALGIRQLGKRGVTLLTILLVPWAMSPMVVALLWQWMFLPAPGGLVASVLATVGLPPPNLLADVTFAMPTLIAVAVWRTFAFATMLIVAGLGQIPADLYKAAAVDGLGALERFRKITLPLLAPTLLIVISLLTISYFNEVQLIIGLTGGGPLRNTTTLAYLLFEAGFVELQQGRGNAIAMVVFVINMLLLFVYAKVLGTK
jgi:ABC-type sugar transport system permease subunit